MTPKIGSVIFDYGYVLNLAPEAWDYANLAAAAGIDGKAFDRVYWGHRAEYDRGTVDGTAYCERIAESVGMQFTSAQITGLVARDTAIWMRLNPVMMDWVQELRKAGSKVAILSNMPIEIARHIRQNAPWFGYFDHMCFSAEVQLAKPEPAIYYSCLEALRAAPAESIFLDDRIENVEGARAVGMHAIRFISPAELLPELGPFNLPALPGKHASVTCDSD